MRPPAVLAALGLAALASGYAVAESPGGDLRAPHRRSGRFFNPWAEDPRTTWGALRWLLLSRNPYGRRGPTLVPRVDNDGAYLAGVEHSATVTWVGHATFAVHDGPDVFLTDPHFGERWKVPERGAPAR